jgi:aconitate hydratase 2/2-methylisocitrate dehydratase
LLELLADRIPPGVDGASKVKAEFLAQVANGKVKSPILDAPKAVELLGTMLGGYNVAPLVELLSSERLGELAAVQLSRTLLIATAFEDVAALAKAGHPNAARVLRSWADADWFT